MKVNANSWHAKVFIAWYQQKYGKTRDVMVYVEGQPVGWDVAPNIPNQTNLCPYMRAVMFWSWMRAFFITPRWEGVSLVFWVLGVAAIGGIGTLLGLHPIPFLKALGMFLGILGTWLLIVGGAHAFSKTKKAEKLAEGIKEFGSLTKAYSLSAHDRVCPEITFETVKK